MAVSGDPDDSLPLSLVVLDDGDDLMLSGVLPSLSRGYQGEVPWGVYEVIVVAHPDREALLAPALLDLGNPARLALAEQPSHQFVERGAKLSRGTHVTWIGSPGVASPLLVAGLLAAFAAFPNGAIILATFELDASRAATRQAWLAGRDWPANPDTLIVQATLGLSAEPRYRWLDPIENPMNVATSRTVATALLEADRNLEPAGIASRRDLTRVQMVGDAMVRPARDPAVRRPPAPDAGGKVDESLNYFGRVRFPPQQSVERPLMYRRTEPARPKISSVLVTYNMRRETPRVLRSLLPDYQQGIDEDDYELIVVDNGSALGLSPEEVKAVAPRAHYFQLQNPPPSPAYALNYGAARATGDIIVILNDGASLLSPGVFAQALAAFRAFPRPVVITQYFYLGPGSQQDTVPAGYDRREEDRLLESISWPDDGYRLFEISWPQTLGEAHGSWLGGWFESDCILMWRSMFEELGGCDERFDLPGGGLMIMDLLVRARQIPGAQPVKLVGEGVFHQYHGGITTTTPAELDDEVLRYKAQYAALRGPVPVDKSFYFMGRLRSAAARSRMKD